MAITVLRTIAELQKQCDELNISLPTDKKLSKTDYILSLREYFIKTKYNGQLPFGLETMLKIESPMLCSRIKELTTERQEEIWNSNEWIAQTKYDGNRCILIYDGNGKFSLFSRNISVEDFLPVDYSDTIWMTGDYSDLKVPFMIDCEILSLDKNVSTIIGKRGVVTETQLQAVSALMAMNPKDSIEIQKSLSAPLEFRVFDCLMYDNQWLLDEPLFNRAKILKPLVDKLNTISTQFQHAVGVVKNKKQFYKYIVDNGGEGIILKNINSVYIASNNRRKEGWIKVKRTMSESMADSVDAFVTGFELADEKKGFAGLVGALIFSTVIKKSDGTTYTHPIAKISAIPLDFRKEITKIDENGNIILDPAVYGRVASIDGQCVSAREKRLKHAVLVNWRPDRSADTCLMDEEFLNSMIL